jgi:hypothetical protein
VGSSSFPRLERQGFKRASDGLLSYSDVEEGIELSPVKLDGLYFSE